VENASYGATVCAERNAIGAMILAGAKHIEGVVVVTPSKSPKTPCGVCRQVLAEFHHHGDFEILSVGSEGAEQCISFSELHPQGFGPKDLAE
jgi:cytidine deaminase